MDSAQRNDFMNNQGAMLNPQNPNNNIINKSNLTVAAPLKRSGQ